jgi:hypothetical protein
VTLHTTLLEAAELSVANYGNLNLGPTNTDKNRGALEGAGLTPTQVARFITLHSSVVAVYDDLPGAGGQATAFKDAAITGNLTPAIRGTETSGGEVDA